MPWWKARRWSGTGLRFESPGDAAVQMVWANMALHMSADPQALIGRWQQLLEPDGFLMFSCLGPDTLRELRDRYAGLGWPPPSHEFTDMHDWGDMLVSAGFAEPVMDMERITLTFPEPERLLQELRGLGRNLHPERFGSLRGKHWRDTLLQSLVPRQAVDERSPQPPSLTFEIIYGHALKARPRLRVQAETTLSLDQMRSALQQSKAAPSRRP
jgi:malonyl-CoA O-methyltransferase